MESVIVTPENYPSIFKAFREIDYDNGAVNRFELEQTCYGVPYAHATSLIECEAALALLSEEEMATFCTGEEDEGLALIKARPALKSAHDLLNAYFDGWQARPETTDGCALYTFEEVEKIRKDVARRCTEIAQEAIDALDEPDFEFNCDIYQPIQQAIRREFGLNPA